MGGQRLARKAIRTMSYIRKAPRGVAIALLALVLPATAHAATPTISCDGLGRLALADAAITLAEPVAAGAYKGAMGGPVFTSSGMNVAGRGQLGANPAFCRVAATLKPNPRSDIRIEVWLPRSGWNGKFLAVGNFGWAGSLMYAGMLTGLQDGYAVASTDTGHDNSSPNGDDGGGRFTLNQPEKLIDYAYRADHAMTVDAKAVIKAFYGVDPARSYWIGCSLGGLEGLIEAKRYPTDYDGIVAGAPPNPLVNFNAMQMWPGWLISQDQSRLIPEGKYSVVHAAVLKACASPIGLKDGLVDEPDKCAFDPGTLLCKGDDAPDCLTASQLYLLQQTYAGPVDPRTKRLIFPGPARGAELGMFRPFASGEPFFIAVDLFRYAAFQNPDWGWKTMDWSKDVDAAAARIGPLMHVDADLKSFFKRGGRLLLYIGWTDYHNPEELIGYYRSLARVSGQQASGAVRLFTIPGMDHCGGGAGCDTFNKLAVIDQWVDRGKTPERIVAAKFADEKLVRTRPLCAYPNVARYKGAGDANDAANFVCAAAWP
jgi:feruloyl esterase